MEASIAIVGRQPYPPFINFVPSLKFDAKLETSVTISPLRCIDSLESHYIFLNPEEIKKFLVLNGDLIPLLFEAPKYIHKIFSNVPLYLELHHDPEAEWDELFIVIKTNYSPEEAVELENRLFEEWFKGVLTKVNGRLNFTEEPL
ncbi:MAG: hypothetical protein ACUVUQ_10010 [Thermodesulfovibrionales bacterium]